VFGLSGGGWYLSRPLEVYVEEEKEEEIRIFRELNQ
jgi:hypothetical protein